MSSAQNGLGARDCVPQDFENATDAGNTIGAYERQRNRRQTLDNAPSLMAVRQPCGTKSRAPPTGPNSTSLYQLCIFRFHLHPLSQIICPSVRLRCGRCAPWRQNLRFLHRGPKARPHNSMGQRPTTKPPEGKALKVRFMHQRMKRAHMAILLGDDNSLLRLKS